MTPYLWLTAYLAKNMFCATKQSLPQYNGWPKKIVTGHGIDLRFWQSDDLPDLNQRNYHEILMVHRLSRSKRVEIAIRALKILPPEYSLKIYGRTVPGEEDYLPELKKLATDLNLADRVTFMGSVPMPELKDVYSKHRIMINMASETIDKTMLEALYYGVYPVTTAGNSEAIGLSLYPQDDEPATLVKFILDKKWEQLSLIDMQSIVKDNHSLPPLITKLISYF